MCQLERRLYKARVYTEHTLLAIEAQEIKLTNALPKCRDLLIEEVTQWLSNTTCNKSLVEGRSPTRSHEYVNSDTTNMASR